MNNSNFWLSNDIKGGLNLLELANTQKAITNFVKILTNKEIPVEFYSNNRGDSMTDGKKITISSSISANTVDSVVGTALHEAAHCKYTNFDELKYLNNTLATKNLMSGKEMISILLNFIEDRRIDNIVYNEAPGYQGYYRSMYKRYFYSKIVDKALKGPEYREENWESYLFRIINIFNKNTDFNALAKLKQIHKLIDLKNINRLINTHESLLVAIRIYKLLIDHFASMTPEERKSQVQQNKQNTSNKFPSKEETKRIFRKQENFIKGEIHKSSLSKKEHQQIEALSKLNIKNKKIKSIDYNGVKRDNVRVHVIDGINKTLINSNLYNIFSLSPLHDNIIDEGISLGKKLLRKLQIRNEQITLASKRLKSGKIDPRRIYAANFEDDLFYKIDKSNYKPISIHLSIDGSGSMNESNKWKSVLTNTIALGYISLYMNNINLTISIRTTGEDPRLSSQTAHIPILLLAFNSKKHTLKDLKKLTHFNPKGLTPEGICLHSLNEYIPNSSYYLDSYLINMSDGYPTFESSKFLYKGKTALLDTAKAVHDIKKKGVKILSYFIQTTTNDYREKELIDNFKIMYGKEASFINPDNINEVTKTLNNLFLKKDLIS
jgi:hypothetical protein